MPFISSQTRSSLIKEFVKSFIDRCSVVRLEHAEHFTEALVSESIILSMTGLEEDSFLFGLSNMENEMIEISRWWTILFWRI